MSAHPESTPPRAAADAASLRVAVVGGDGAGAYDMFEVVSVDGLGAKLRGSVLFEVSEEVPLRLTRGGATVEVRARVTGHERVAGGAVTALVFVGGETDVRRLLGG